MAENQLIQLKNSTTDLENRIQSLKVKLTQLICSMTGMILIFKDEVKENQTKQKEISTSEQFDKNNVERYGVSLKDFKKEIINKQNVLEDYTKEASAVGERPSDLRLVSDAVIFHH